jgi:hypothetical protein
MSGRGCTEKCTCAIEGCTCTNNAHNTPVGSPHRKRPLPSILERTPQKKQGLGPERELKRARIELLLMHTKYQDLQRKYQELYRKENARSETDRLPESVLVGEALPVLEWDTMLSDVDGFLV